MFDLIGGERRRAASLRHFGVPEVPDILAFVAATWPVGVGVT
jgi:hypothetical protein